MLQDLHLSLFSISCVKHTVPYDYFRDAPQVFIIEEHLKAVPTSFSGQDFQKLLSQRIL